MTDRHGYATPAAVEAAIADAARNAHAVDRSLTVQERIRLEYFNRFLSRVFVDPNDSGWILKGGTGMLARVSSARATTDVDLFRSSTSLDIALAALLRVAAVDLDDHFRFVFIERTTVLDGNQQNYAEGYRVRFDIYIGAKQKGPLHVDLVINVATTDDVEVGEPANALDLPKLTSSAYRLYPVVDQIADKVCATLALYQGRPSSREKDLVDLVVLAVTQEVDEQKLRRALEAESASRSLILPKSFELPPSWGVRYAKLAGSVAACEDYRTIKQARSLMHLFIDAVLEGTSAGKKRDGTKPGWV